MHKIDPNVFCVNPWYWIRINALGEISYCARAVDFCAESTGNLLKDFTSHPYILSARKEFLNSRFPKACNRCKAEESISGPFRKSQNKLAAIYPDWFDESLKQSPVYSRLSKTQIRPRAVFVMFSNKCNLTCRMCSRLASSKLAEVYDQYNYTINYNHDDAEFRASEINNATAVNNWASNKEKWLDFLNFILDNPDLEILQLNGGELFVQPEFYQLIDFLLLHNRTNLKIIITTNGTVANDEILLKLQKFQSCFIDISAETLTNTNDYIRVGSDVQSIAANLRKFIKFSTNKLQFGVHLTPQAYSVETLDTLLDFCIKHNLETVANQVHPQKYLQIMVLPTEIKTQTYNRLKEKYSNLSQYNPSIAHAIEKIFHWLCTPDSANIEQLRKQFVRHTQEHDKMLGTNFSKTYPHLVNFFKDYGYECN